MSEDLTGELVRVLAHLVGCANESPKYGPFDCIDNCGQSYQSADFAVAWRLARETLAKADRARLYSPPSPNPA